MRISQYFLVSSMIFAKYTQSPKDSEFVDPVLGLSGTFSTALRLRAVSPSLNCFHDGG
jgi:hypothetical protein